MILLEQVVTGIPRMSSSSKLLTDPIMFRIARCPGRDEQGRPRLCEDLAIDVRVRDCNGTKPLVFAIATIAKLLLSRGSRVLRQRLEPVVRIEHNLIVH